MRVLISYFSGTGNTAYNARLIEQELKERELPAEIDVIPLERIVMENLPEYDCVCFGFPVYALDSPQIVKDKLESIPMVQNKGLFLYCTMGLAAGNALRNNLKYFTDKGYILLGSAKILMPGSDGLAMMKKGTPYVIKALAKNYKEQSSLTDFLDHIEQQILKLNSGTPIETLELKMRNNIWDTLFGWTLRLSYKGMIKWFKSLYRADENCTRCGICAKICPVNNITVSPDGVEFGENCILCLRCVHQCPVESIQLGKLTVGKFRWRGPDGKYAPISYMK